MLNENNMLDKHFLKLHYHWSAPPHQIIKVNATATGILSKVSYAANTMCEWWIQVTVCRLFPFQ